MKKLFLFFTLMALSMSAMAETLIINNKAFDVATSNSDLSVDGKTSGTISWDSSRKKLTFKNVEMNASDNVGVYYDGDHITVAFEGKNVLKSNYHCLLINVSNYCDITSTEELGPTAYAELSNTNPNSAHNCIFMSGGGSLNIMNIYLNVTSESSCPLFSNNNSKLSIESAWVHLKSGNFAAAAGGFSSCNVSYGSYLEKGSYDASKKTFVDGTSVMSEVKILPELTVGGVIVGVYGSDYVGINPKGMTSGGITYENGDLTFNGVRGAIGDANLPENYGNTLVRNNMRDGVRVLVKGVNNITAASGASTSYGLITKNNKPLSIMGITADYQSDRLTYTGDTCVLADGPLEFYCVTATLTGKRPVQANTMSPLFHQSKVTATVPNPDKTSLAISCMDPKLEGCDVANGYVDTYGFYAKGSSSNVTNVKIDVPSYYYGVKVMGRQLNDVNISEFDCYGFEGGTLSYNTSTNTLTMRDVFINVDWSDCPAIEAANGEINFERDNQICTGDMPALLFTGSNLTISTKYDKNNSVNNCVVFVSRRGLGCNITSNGTLTLKGDEIIFSGYTGGLKGGNNSKLKLLRGSKYDVYGFYSQDIANGHAPTPYPAFTVGTLINEDGAGFDFTNSYDYNCEPAYWDAAKKMPINNGGDFAQKVLMAPITEKYGLFVAGIQVNNLNCYGMAGKAFTKTGPEQVTYNPSTGALKLNNAYIDMKAAGIAANAIELNRYDYGEPSHSIELNGENYVSSYNGYNGIYALSDAVISSETKDFKSSLEIYGSGGDGKGINHENLTIKDRAIVKLTGVKGTGVGNPDFPNRANLTVDDATLDVTMYGIQNIKSLTLKNGSSIVYPEGAKFDSNKQAVVDADGKTAMKVQIRSINDNVTPMSGELAINEKNFPDSKFRSYIANNFDSNKNDYLSDMEISAVTSIDVSAIRFAIDDYGLKGIEFFTELTLLNCSECGLSSLDLSKNTKLQWLNAPGNNFDNGIDLSNNPELVSATLNRCHMKKFLLPNQLKISWAVDISNNEIRGQAMTDFVNSLLPKESMGLFVDVIVCNNEGENGNRITRAQAAIAKAKNWNLQVDEYASSGDVNGDNSVDVADIATIIDVMAGKGDEATMAAADVNGDKQVDVADIATVIDIMAGKE